MWLTCPLPPPPPPFVLSPPLETEQEEEEEEEAVESTGKKTHYYYYIILCGKWRSPSLPKRKALPSYVCTPYRISAVRPSEHVFRRRHMLIPRFFWMDLFIILTHLPTYPIYEKQTDRNCFKSPSPLCPHTTKNPPPQCSFVPQARYLVVHEDEGTRIRFIFFLFSTSFPRAIQGGEGGGGREEEKQEQAWQKKHWPIFFITLSVPKCFLN